MSDPKDTMDWVINNFSPDMGAYEQDLYDASDTLLLGRTTHELMKNFWPTDLAREMDPETAEFMNETPKFVVSHEQSLPLYNLSALHFVI